MILEGGTRYKKHDLELYEISAVMSKGIEELKFAIAEEMQKLGSSAKRSRIRRRDRTFRRVPRLSRPLREAGMFPASARDGKCTTSEVAEKTLPLPLF